MRLSNTGLLVVGFAVSMLAGVIGWILLSRPTVVDVPGVGIRTTHRVLGRTIGISLDADRDGRADAGSVFGWSDTYAGTIDGPGCLDAAQQHWQDSDLDGRPETWFRPHPPHPDTGCRYSWNVDTDGDGQPDWSFVTEPDPDRDVVAEIRQRLAAKGPSQPSP